MKRLRIEFGRIYFRYLIWSTDRLLDKAKKEREKESATATGSAKPVVIC